MTRTRMLSLWIAALALAGGCEKFKDHHDDDDDGGDDGAAEDDAEAGAAEDDTAAHIVEGSISKDAAAAPFEGNDAQGTVYVVMFADACGGTDVVANAAITDADLAAAGSSAPFLLEPIEPGHYFLTAFLDDNGDYDAAAPGPNKGDIVMAQGAGPACLEIDVVDADVAGADAVLNLALPFDPP